MEVAFVQTTRPEKENERKERKERWTACWCFLTCGLFVFLLFLLFLVVVVASLVVQKQSLLLR